MTKHLTELTKDTQYEQVEKDACSYVLQTSTACMQFDEICTNFAVSAYEYISKTDYEHIKEIWKENKDIAKSCAKYEYEILDGRWFEYMGDAASDHNTAIFFYERGILNPNISALPSIVVKYLGCANIKCVPEKVHNAILDIKKKGLDIPNKRIPGLCFLTRVQKRWENGKALYFHYDL